jgi:hypothetical protein
VQIVYRDLLTRHAAAPVLDVGESSNNDADAENARRAAVAWR